MISENAQATEMQGGNSDEPCRGGDTRSSEEADVMTVEQRGTEKEDSESRQSVTE